MKRRIQSVLLIAIIVCGMLFPGTSASAATDTDRNLDAKRGYKPITVFEVSAEGFAEMPAIEKISSTEIPVEDQRYWKQFSTEYYYTYFLNDAEKAFWNELENMCIAMATTEQNYSKQPTGDTYLADVIDRWVPCATSVPEERMIDLMYLFINSNPQYYFLSNEIGFTYTSWGDLYGGILVLYDEFTNGKTRKNYTKQFTGKIDAWVADVEAQTKPEEKVKRAHDIICQNTVYQSNAFDQSAYSMVCLGETVCAGYTETMQILMNAVGIESLFVASDGSATSDGGHAWNMVQLHGVWYGIDVTWDDGSNGRIYYDFYNKSRYTLGREGQHDEEYPYSEMLVESSYDMLEDGYYKSPYFTQANVTYFIVNDNANLAELLVKPIDANTNAPLTVVYGGKTYNVIGGNAGVSNATDLVKAFVERMYTVALNRTAEPSGHEYWSNALLELKIDGAGVAREFILGQEFVGKNYSNKQFITVLYKTFFDRDADPEGTAYWTKELSMGKSRASVLSGFVNSNEFDTICSHYGISRGILKTDGNAINPGIGQFAERLYTKILERSSEKAGREYWTLEIAEGRCTPASAARSFFYSEEYLKKKTTDVQYLNALYRTFMGREADQEGMSFWQNSLKNGMSRDQALDSFVNCAEFQQIMKNYGL